MLVNKYHFENLMTQNEYYGLIGFLRSSGVKTIEKPTQGFFINIVWFDIKEALKAVSGKPKDQRPQTLNAMKIRLAAVTQVFRLMVEINKDDKSKILLNRI